MTEPRPADDDIPARLAAVEDELARIRPQLRAATADSAAARIMASGADRDVAEVRGELRAHTRTLNALRQDQLDARAETAALRTEFKAEMAEFKAEMAEFKAEMAEFREETRHGFATAQQGMSQIVEILGRIEGAG
jgi:chromosome segregation ATPase